MSTREKIRLITRAPSTMMLLYNTHKPRQLIVKSLFPIEDTTENDKITFMSADTLRELASL